MEARSDILVYTSEPFKEGTEVSGPITPTLYVSSDAKDTDFTVKVLDVYPDGRAYNLDESIQRMRYRDGYDKPLVWMEKDKVYKVALQPLTTSNYFAAGHRLRIEVSSSNFPRFDRNLNTGGNNYDESKGVVARNVVHHSTQYPSSMTITVVKKPTATAVAIEGKSQKAEVRLSFGGTEMSRVFVSALALSLFIAGSAFAQGGGASATGTIQGKVTDSSNAVLPGVTVTATSPSMIGTQTQVSNENGSYRFPAVPPGVYSLTLS